MPNDSALFQMPSWPIADASVEAAFRAMMVDGSWGRYHGAHCDALRQALQDFHGLEHVMLCSSGTAALELALRSIPVQAGDEVVMSAYDFKANFVNVLLLGAVPVLVDTLAGLPVIDPEQLASACTERTRAILVSHLHGSFAPMHRVMEIARERQIMVIEDACQAPGAILNGRRAGTMGDVGVLSFGGSKLLTSGRGGAVMTNDASAAQRIRLFTQRGNDAYPLSEMQAAVLLPQLHVLDEWNSFRSRRVQVIAESWRAGNVSPLIDQHNAPVDVPAYYKIAMRCYTATESNGFRDRLCEKSRALGIPLDPAFPGLHMIHSRKRFRSHGELPNATRLHHELMGLHHTALLLDDETLKQMVGKLSEMVLGGV